MDGTLSSPGSTAGLHVEIQQCSPDIFNSPCIVMPMPLSTLNQVSVLSGVPVSIGMENYNHGQQRSIPILNLSKLVRGALRARYLYYTAHRLVMIVTDLTIESTGQKSNEIRLAYTALVRRGMQVSGIPTGLVKQDKLS